jgi:hypothetical protein
MTLASTSATAKDTAMNPVEMLLRLKDTPISGCFGSNGSSVRNAARDRGFMVRRETEAADVE